MLTDLIEDLLKRAEAAHLAREQELGASVDWPQFYTEHLHRALGDQYSVEQVGLALRNAAAAHGVHEEQELGGVRDEQWPRWYAEHMAATLSREWFVRAAQEHETWDA